MKTAILGLHAETSIHAGAGSALDVIDLPIQREAHTNWPCVFGSAVKGALRAAAGKGEQTNLVFGLENANSDAYAGALLVGDARLLLLPVRSLTSHFKWITCPAVLQRYQRDAERMGKSVKFTVPKIEGDMQAIAATAGEVFLEEYRFEVKQADLKEVIDALVQVSDVAGFAEALKNQLMILSNDDFSYLAKHAVPVTPHIALDSETKAVKPGALWYEETLPPETLLYVCLAANDARKKDSVLSADAVLQTVQEMFASKPYLQLGGNETVGMGWCRVKVGA
ncbi:MAG: type III-B CRISPR module RAMP protein Cmr4 [Gallionella sp.]